MLKQDFKVFVMHLSNVSSRGGGGGGGRGQGGYCFSVGWGNSRDLIYLFMISGPLSSVVEIKDLGIRQPNQSLPSRI